MESLLISETTKMLSPAVLSDPKVADVRGVLYILDGDYLYRYPADGGWRAKFLTAHDVAAAFADREEDTGWLPPGIVRAGYGAAGPWYVYSAPPQIVQLTIEGEEPITIPIPRTVLMGTGKNHYLWALQAKYFSRDDRPYLAPFPNVYNTGRICWGRNPQPPINAEQARAAWDLFFGSPFNRDMSAGKSKEYTDDVRDRLRSLAGKKSYPVADLVPMSGEYHTIGKAIESILEG